MDINAPSGSGSTSPTDLFSFFSRDSESLSLPLWLVVHYQPFIIFGFRSFIFRARCITYLYLPLLLPWFLASLHYLTSSYLPSIYDTVFKHCRA